MYHISDKDLIKKDKKKYNLSLSLPKKNNSVISRNIKSLNNIYSNSTEEVPKIIHCLWLDFNNKKDGNIEGLGLFINRIIDLHQDYKLNFIFNYDKCIRDIEKYEEYDWIIKILNNNYIGPAHKSDVLRFFYLYTMGGVWLDISTFIISPIEEIRLKNLYGFTCFYIPHKIAQYWVINPLSVLSNILDTCHFEKIIDATIKEQPLLKKNIDYNFIPENYFIIAPKNHNVCKIILNNFYIFYKNIEDFDSYKSVNNLNNEYIHRLFNFVYNKNENDIFKSSSFKYKNKSILDFDKCTPFYIHIQEQLTFIYNNKEKRERFLNEIYNGGYLFNYFMLYIAILEHYNKYTRKYVLDDNYRNRETALNNIYDNNKTFINLLCKNNEDDRDILNCSDILYIHKYNNNNKDKLLLLSATYNRAIRWSDKLHIRLNWNETGIDIILKSSKNEKEIIKKLKDIDVYQLKFGSMVRNDKSAINIIKEKFQKYDFYEPFINRGNYDDDLNEWINIILRKIAISINGGSKNKKKIIKKRK